MYSDSRKAQYNSFAHHRAQLLFSRLIADKAEGELWSATIHEGTEPLETSKTLPQRVVAGVLNVGPRPQVAA
jgi:hypothetical protein